MSSLIDVGKNPTNVNVSSLDNTTVFAKKIQHMKTITQTQALTKYNKPDIQYQHNFKMCSVVGSYYILGW